MDPFAAFCRDVHNKAFWLELAPWLHVGSSAVPRAPDPVAPRAAPPAWRSAGYLELPSLLAPAAADALARAVSALRSNDLHPTFVYVYDEAWQILDALRPWLTRLLGDGYEVLADAWAFLVDPRRDAGGWPVHRGWYEDVRDGGGSPGLVNVWVSLTEATERNACMHVVPLSRDPHHPGDLREVAGLGGLAVALPTKPGGVLLWSANAAHWGGRCDPSFDQPRISLTFTARRAASSWTDARPVRPPLTFAERLDVIAEQFVTYGERELDAGRPEMRWAALVAGMRAAAMHSLRSRV